MQCKVRLILSLLPLLLLRAFLFSRHPRLARAHSAAMVKDKTAALEHAKKAMVTAKGKKTARGTSSRSGLPPGWIQEDWIRSTIERDDLERLAEDDMIAVGSWRLPGKESEPQPWDGERVLLATHVDRGFSLPPHPFFRGFLNFFFPTQSRTSPRLCPCVRISWVVNRTGVFSNTSSQSALRL